MFTVSKSNGRRAILPARHSEEVIMIVEEYIQEKMSFAQQELAAAPAAWCAPLFDGAEPISSLTRTQTECVIDFFEAGNRLPAGLEASSEEFGLNRKASKILARQLPSLGRIDRLEESLYWFISAATLIYLLFEIVTS
jgi:hypothetical protein